MKVKSRLFRARDILTNEWVYGTYMDNGGTPLIVRSVELQDSGDVRFDYAFVHSNTLEIANPARLEYFREWKGSSRESSNPVEPEGWEEVAHCPDCDNRFGSFEKPNFCPKCGLPLDWTRFAIKED